jgi:hypothetical protein
MKKEDCKGGPRRWCPPMLEVSIAADAWYENFLFQRLFWRLRNTYSEKFQWNGLATP